MHNFLTIYISSGKRVLHLSGKIRRRAEDQVPIWGSRYLELFSK